MKRFTFPILVVFTSFAYAGPNWKAIEDARNEKHEQKQTVAKQKSRHEQALEKLQLACEKVKNDPELAKACEEIIAADKEAAAN